MEILLSQYSGDFIFTFYLYLLIYLFVSFSFNFISWWLGLIIIIIIKPEHEISINVVCSTSKASDQPAHTRSLIGAFASRLSIL